MTTIDLDSPDDYKYDETAEWKVGAVSLRVPRDLVQSQQAAMDGLIETKPVIFSRICIYKIK